MAINPKIDDVQDGDIFVSDVFTADGEAFIFISTVINVGPIVNKDAGNDRMLVVQVQDQAGRYTEYEGKKAWFSKLAVGLV